MRRDSRRYLTSIPALGIATALASGAATVSADIPPAVKQEPPKRPLQGSKKDALTSLSGQATVSPTDGETLDAKMRAPRERRVPLRSLLYENSQGPVSLSNEPSGMSPTVGQGVPTVPPPPPPPNPKGKPPPPAAASKAKAEIAPPPKPPTP